MSLRGNHSGSIRASSEIAVTTPIAAATAAIVSRSPSRRWAAAKSTKTPR